jgi:hypothetical protein
MERYPEQSDLTHVNMLAELHMAQGSYTKAIEIVARAKEQFCNGEPVPVDLSVKVHG